MNSWFILVLFILILTLSLTTNADLKLVVLRVWRSFHQGRPYLKIIAKFNFSHSKPVYICIDVVKGSIFVFLKFYLKIMFYI